MQHIQAQTLDTDLQLRLDEMVVQALSDLNLPGLAVTIIEDGEVIYSNNLSLDANARFHVASLTKSMTGLAIMQLGQEGLVDLDADFKNYLDGFEAEAPDGLNITLRQLLNHTSGISMRVGNHWTKPASTLQEEVRMYQGLGTATVPGEQFAYSNSNYNILGAVIESVSGLKYEEYIQTRILIPLGMNDSNFDSGYRLATGHSRFFGLQIPMRETVYFHNYVSSAGLISTAADMATYIAALMNPDYLAAIGILDQARYSQFFSRGVRLSADEYYGGGLYESALGERTIYFHDGGYAGFSSRLLMIPDVSLGVIVLSNSLLVTGDDLFQTLPRRLAGVILGAELDEPEPDYSYPLILAAFLLLVFLQAYRLVQVRRLMSAQSIRALQAKGTWRKSSRRVAWFLYDSAVLYIAVSALPSELGIGLRSMYLFLLDFAVLLGLLVLLSLVLWMVNLYALIRIGQNKLLAPHIKI